MVAEASSGQEHQMAKSIKWPKASKDHKSFLAGNRVADDAQACEIDRRSPVR